MATPILLHACCGPCAIMPAIRLKEEGFQPVLWFMNPNVQPLSEYLRRREAAETCAALLGCKIIFEDATWNLQKWLAEQMEHPEAPERCHWCVASRVEQARLTAENLGFSFFTTSLLYSIYQPHEHIRQVGEGLDKEEGPGFVYRDFRQDWREGIERSKEWNLYRQPYCGCVFSEAERYAKKLSKLVAK